MTGADNAHKTAYVCIYKTNGMGFQVSEADIRKFMPPDMEYIQEQPGLSAKQTAVSSDSVSVATQPRVQLTAAQEQGKLLDIMLVAREQENRKRADARIASYDASVKIPCQDALP